MKPSALFVVMVTAYVLIHAEGSKFTITRRYCGRSLVSGILQACGMITRRDLQSVQKRSLDGVQQSTGGRNELGSDYGDIGDMPMRLKLALLLAEHVQEQDPDDDVTSDADNMASASRVKRIGLLPTQLLLEKCCSVGCSYMDMAKVC